MHKELYIKARDGYEIASTLYLPDGGVSRVLIIGSDVLSGQQDYSAFADHIHRFDTAVITFDFRGIGKSSPECLKGHQAYLHQWGNLDLDAVILEAKHRFPEQELIYLAHGVSGQLIGLAPASQYLSKLIFVNCALSCWRLWPWYAQIKIFFMKAVNRILTKVFGYFPGEKIGFMQDLPKGVAVEFSDWCSMHNGLFDVFPDANFRKLQIPILAYSFTDNWHSPREAVEALLNHYPGASISWHHLKPNDVNQKNIDHSGFFEPKCKHSLWSDLLNWINHNQKQQLIL